MTAEARPKPLLTVAEAGRELGIGTTTAYEWARQGELPGLVKLGGRSYVRRAVLIAFLNGADVLPAAERGVTTDTAGSFRPLRTGDQSEQHEATPSPTKSRRRFAEDDHRDALTKIDV